MTSILIIGCGTIGQALGDALVKQGHQVIGLRRRPPTTLSSFKFIAADITSQAAINQLDLAVDLVFFIVSADGRTEQSYREVYQYGLSNTLNQWRNVPWFFVSSTSVYGQTQGEWVDEASPTQPLGITSQLIVQAEQQVRAAHPLNVVVRFSGIYGPGREYLLRMAKQAPTIQQSPPYYTNRIHQQDCVGVLNFLCQQRLAGRALDACYLASDLDPAPLWEVIDWLSTHRHCLPPQAKPIDPKAERNKRCSSRRLQALGYTFLYASYRDGYLPLIHE